jgi:LysM repeat protein
VRRSSGVARWLAPAAFLAGVTIAVLLIRAGLNDPGGTTSATTAAVRTSTRTSAARTTPRRPRTRTATTAVGAQYYTVESGDTYGSIAAKNGTTVTELEQLNPGVSSNSLSVGQRIRVK